LIVDAARYSEAQRRKAFRGERARELGGQYELSAEADILNVD